MGPFEQEQGALGRHVFSVSQVVTGLRALLEEKVGELWIEGEVSNVHRASSGHVYFTLKDKDSQLRSALFRNYAQRVPFDLEDGLSVVVSGELSVYSQRGDLQIVVRDVHPKGLGSLQLAFDQLHAALQTEGLFDENLKRELPQYPGTIGVVTSEKGAAIHDVIEVLAGRAPDVPILLAPASVQGAGAALELAEGLKSLGACEDVGVILLVRGGGSLEDLAPFNTELLARAIRASETPIVSGVGHETDVTIADLASDLRAPTPSAAAALVVEDREVLSDRLGHLGDQLILTFERSRNLLEKDWLLKESQLEGNAPWIRLGDHRSNLLRLSARLKESMRRILENSRTELVVRAGSLDALSPLAVLGRGYSIATNREGAAVLSASDLKTGDRLSLRFYEGETQVVIEEVSEEDPLS